MGDTFGTDFGRSVFERFRDGEEGSWDRAISGFSGSGCCGGGAGGSEKRGFESVRKGSAEPLTSGAFGASMIGTCSFSLISSFESNEPKKPSALPSSFVCSRATRISCLLILASAISTIL